MEINASYRVAWHILKERIFEKKNWERKELLDLMDKILFDTVIEDAHE